MFPSKAHSLNLVCATDGTKHLFKSVCEAVLKSLFWIPNCVPGFEYTPWLGCRKCHCPFANQADAQFETYYW